MKDVGRKSYPYMEEVNEALLRHERDLPRRSRVLDVGCGRGALAAAMAERGHEVWGVENAPEAVAVARTRLHRVLAHDLLDVDAVVADAGGARFDAIVFSDVLEHVYDPRTVIERYAALLTPRGRLLISVPNAVVWEQRVRVLLGRFRYDDTGLMDRTHIRFFTRETLRELVEAGGYRIDVEDADPHLVRAALPLLKKTILRGGGDSTDKGARGIIDSPAYRMYLRAVYPWERALAARLPGLLAFRLVAVAHKL